MRKGHHSQANGPSTLPVNEVDWQVLGPLAEFYAMSGRLPSGLEITLSGVSGPCPENRVGGGISPPASHTTGHAGPRPAVPGSPDG